MVINAIELLDSDPAIGHRTLSQLESLNIEGEATYYVIILSEVILGVTTDS